MRMLDFLHKAATSGEVDAYGKVGHRGTPT